MYLLLWLGHHCGMSGRTRAAEGATVDGSAAGQCTTVVGVTGDNVPTSRIAQSPSTALRLSQI